MTARETLLGTSTSRRTCPFCPRPDLPPIDDPPIKDSPVGFRRSTTRPPRRLIRSHAAGTRRGRDRAQATGRASGGNRTHNLRFTKPLLCRLSYASLYSAPRKPVNILNRTSYARRRGCENFRSLTPLRGSICDPRLASPVGPGTGSPLERTKLAERFPAQKRANVVRSAITRTVRTNLRFTRRRFPTLATENNLRYARSPAKHDPLSRGATLHDRRWVEVPNVTARRAASSVERCGKLPSAAAANPLPRLAPTTCRPIPEARHAALPPPYEASTAPGPRSAEPAPSSRPTRRRPPSGSAAHDRGPGRTGG